MFHDKEFLVYLGLGPMSSVKSVATSKFGGYNFGGFHYFWAYFMQFQAFTTRTDSFGGLNPEKPYKGSSIYDVQKKIGVLTPSPHCIHELDLLVDVHMSST